MYIIMKNHTSELLGERSFEYGEHTVLIRVEIRHEYNSFSAVNYGCSGIGYYRVVQVFANKGYTRMPVFNSDIGAQSIARLDDPDWNICWKLLRRLDVAASRYIPWNDTHRRWAVVDLETQIERTTREVLSEIDTIHEVNSEEHGIDMEVGVTKMKQEASMFEYDDMDYIDRELEREKSKTT